MQGFKALIRPKLRRLKNARVKSFNMAKIEMLEEKLSNMDLSRNAYIVLYILEEMILTPE